MLPQLHHLSILQHYRSIPAVQKVPFLLVQKVEVGIKLVGGWMQAELPWAISKPWLEGEFRGSYKSFNTFMLLKLLYLTESLVYMLLSLASFAPSRLQLSSYE